MLCVAHQKYILLQKILLGEGIGDCFGEGNRDSNGDGNGDSEGDSNGHVECNKEDKGGRQQC